MTGPSDDLILGGSDAQIVLQGVDEVDRAVGALFSQARRCLVVRALRFEWPYLRSPSMQEQVERLVTGGLHNRIHLLVDDEQDFLRNWSRMLDLCRRFSSYVFARKLADEHRQDSAAFVVADELAVVHQPRADIPRGVVNMNTPGEARRLQHRFQDQWQYSKTIDELFTLGL